MPKTSDSLGFTSEIKDIRLTLGIKGSHGVARGGGRARCVRTSGGYFRLQFFFVLGVVGWWPYTERKPCAQRVGVVSKRICSSTARHELPVGAFESARGSGVDGGESSAA